MGEFQYPWQRLLEDAIDETDLQKLPEKLAAAEGAIFLRCQQLTDSHNHHEESEALNSDVFKKYSQMKLAMKREALEQINRRANEMTFDEAPAAPVYGGFGTVLVQ